MNQLIAMSGEMTMSSREIAYLTSSTHDNVLKSIRKLVSEGVVSCNETQYRHEQNNQMYPEFTLNFRDTMVVVSGYSAELRARIIDRWQQLEQASKPAIPQTYSAALLEAGRLALELEQSQQQLALTAPKADVFDKVIERENLLNATQVAQQVGMSAVKMNKQLDVIGGVYSKSVKRGRTFCHGWVESGYGEMKIGESGYPQALFTTKGSLRVVELFTSEGVI